MATSKDTENLKVFTPIGTVSFPHVWEPHSFQAGQEPNYSIILVFAEGTDLKALKKACSVAAKNRWADKAADMFKKGQLRMPWRPGSDYAEYGEPFVEGTTFVTAKTKQAPGIVDHRAKPIINQMDFYAGCMARASVYCHAYDTMGNKGVTLLLNNIQKTGEGTRLSGRKSAEDEFDPIEGSSKDDEDDDIPF